MAFTCFFRIQCQWCPDISLCIETKVGRHDADDCVAFTIQCNRLTNDTAIATEPTLPKIIAEHDNMIATGAILIRRKSPARLRIDSKQLKQIAGYLKSLQPFWFTRVCEVNRPTFIAQGRNIAERFAIRLQIQKASWCKWNSCLGLVTT